MHMNELFPIIILTLFGILVLYWLFKPESKKPKSTIPQYAFQHSSGVIKIVGNKTWLWAFLFNPIYFLLHRNYLHAAIHFVVVIPLIATIPLVGILANAVYAVLAQKLIRENYLIKGWEEGEYTPPSE